MDKSTKRRLVDGDITRQHSYCDEMVVQNWGMLRYDGTPPSPPPKKKYSVWGQTHIKSVFTFYRLYGSYTWLNPCAPTGKKT